MVFALLPDKARTTYNRMFDAIKGIQPNLAPDTMMVDLELTLHRSIRDAFPAKYILAKMLISFCAVHLQKDNTGGRRGWRHTIFALIYRNQLELMGLTFVPEHDNAGTWTALLHKRYLAYKFSICKFLLINYYNH